MKKYDIVIIGSGTHLREILRQNIKGKILLINETPYFGGECLHKTCMPLYYLYTTAKYLNMMQKSYNYGIMFDIVRFDYLMMKSQFNLYKEMLIRELKSKIKEKNIEVLNVPLEKIHIEKESKKIIIGNEEISYQRLILSPDPIYEFNHPVLKVDKHIVYYAPDFMEYNRDLEKVVIYGCDSFTYSLASIYSNLSGVETYYVLPCDDFLYDIEVSEVIKTNLFDIINKNNKMNIIRGDIIDYKRHENKATIKVNNEQITDVDLILVETKRKNPIKISDQELSNKYYPPFHDFYIMRDKGEYIKNINFVLGLPSIAYHLPKDYSDVVILKGEDIPLRQLNDADENTLIRIYLKNNQVMGYEIISNYAEIFAQYLEVFINHNLSFDKEIFFYPHFLSVLDKIQRV